MSKVELIEEITKEAKGVSKKDVETVVDAFICTIKDALKSGEEVRFIGFGSFLPKTKKAHKGINPSTGATINIPASKTISFKISKKFKEEIN